MTSPVDQYYQWVNTTAQAWASHANDMANKMSAGTYSSNDMLNDASQCATVAAQMAVGFLDMVLEIGQSMGWGPPGAGPETSDTFGAPTRSTGLRTIKMKAPLADPLTNETIPDSAVSFLPPTLGPGVDDFQLVVQPTAGSGSIYFGVVELAPAAGSADPTEDVDVWVQIP